MNAEGRAEGGHGFALGYQAGAEAGRGSGRSRLIRGLTRISVKFNAAWFTPGGVLLLVRRASPEKLTALSNREHRSRRQRRCVR